MLFERINKALEYIQQRTALAPDIGVILGTGLSDLISDFEVRNIIDFKDIPHFPIPTVSTHGAQMIFGSYRGKNIVALTGRFHYYEGYEMHEITFGVRVLGLLGIRKLLITNITGSTNEVFELGDLVTIKDHINLQSANPLRPRALIDKHGNRIVHKHDDRLGPRFPSMINAYDSKLRELAKTTARNLAIQLHEGTYLAMNGPSLETAAEYQMINQLGGDVVGMSTVPEVIVAKQIGLRTLVLSIVSNKCFPIHEIKEDNLESILENVHKGVPNLKKLLSEIIAKVE